jgi:hypothetical protein
LGACDDFSHPLNWSSISGLKLCLIADQKQQHANVFEQLLQIASDDATLLFKVITGDESWIYWNDPQTKQQSSQWKSPNSSRPKKW